MRLGCCAHIGFLAKRSGAGVYDTEYYLYLQVEKGYVEALINVVHIFRFQGHIAYMLITHIRTMET